jgi:hypothetical protein
MGVRLVGLDELLAESDFMSVHLPKTPETLGLIGEAELAKVKPSLVLAALIIGAALLSRVKTDVTIAGYPAIAFVLFLLAALGGAWLCLTIAVSDRKLRRK